LKTSPTAVTEPQIKDDEIELEDEVVLVEKVQTDGTIEKIIFASGGEVDVYELELLCDKVIQLAAVSLVWLFCFLCEFRNWFMRNFTFVYCIFWHALKCGRWGR
jgi:hypothetical protein